MNTSELFGFQFALNNRFKAQIIEDFDRWKSEKQWFLAEEKNKIKLAEKVVNKHREEHPKDYRSPEDVATELWEKLKVKVAKTNWQHVFEEVLGSDYQVPNYNGSPYITRQNVKDLLFEGNCKHYYFTQSAVQESEKVYVSEPLDMGWLWDSSNGKRQINFGDQFIRYEKKGSRIIALAASFTRRQEHNFLEHTFFVLDLREQKFHQPKFDPLVDLILDAFEEEFDNDAKAFDKKYLMLLYNMITFLDLIPLRKITLPAGKSTGANLSSSDQGDPSDYLDNNENIPIAVVSVNANWNCTIYIEEKEVTGHFKNVLCGRGRSKVVRRFVKSYHRDGYERPAQKLKSAGM